MESSMNDSGVSGSELQQQTSEPSSPRSISSSSNTLVNPDIQQTPSIPRSCPIWPDICDKTPDWEDKNDPGKNLEDPCHGWPELAQWMCEYPALETFQSFKDLHVKSLLYYQAELAGMRKKLHFQEWADHRAGKFKFASRLSSRADLLLFLEGKPEAGASKQIDLVKKMRGVLKEYSDALLQYSKINELPTADPFNVNTLHNKLRKPQSENRDCHIAGDGSDSWGNLGEPLSEKNLREQFIHFLQSLTIFWAEKPKKPFHHLVVPGKKRDVDGLTRWITSQWIPFWDAVRKYITAINDPPEDDPEGQITDKKDDEIRPSSVSSAPTLVKQISRAFIRRRSSTSTEASTDDAPKKAKKELITYGIRRIRSFTTFVTTIVACLLPTAAIAILATMHSTAEVLGFIGLFTALFAGGLMCLTDPTTSRTEIFTATAAFSAVLVVFVQNQNGAPSGTNG